MSTIRSVPNRSFSRKSLETLDERLTELEENKTVANPELSGDEEALNSIEIDGVKYKIEGSGGGGSPTPVLYKHSLELTFQVESSQQTCTVNFLSKYDTQFVNNGSLDNFVTNLLSLYQSQNDTNIYISPTIQVDSNFIMITQIHPGDDGLYFTLIVGQNTVVWRAYYEDNASGITDTVTPYIIAQGGGTGESTTITPELYTFTFGNLTAGPLFLYMTASQYNQLVQALSQAGYTISSPSDIENLYNNGTLLERLTGLGVIDLFKIGGSADGYLLAGYEIDQNTGSITVNYFENDGTINTSTCTAQDVEASTLSIGYVSQTISGGGESSSTGSGKLYELTMEITRYAINVTSTWHSQQGKTLQTLPLTICIYESNWESIKEKVNNLIELLNTQWHTTLPLLTDINSLVSFINTYANETTGSEISLPYAFLDYVISLCDKAYFTCNNNENYVLMSNGGSKLIFPYNSSNDYFDMFFEYNDVPYTYGINVNNTCVLHEYGTSGGGETTTRVKYHIEVADSNSNKAIIPIYKDDFDKYLVEMNQVGQQLATALSITWTTLNTIDDLQNTFDDLKDTQLSYGCDLAMNLLVKYAYESGENPILSDTILNYTINLIIKYNLSNNHLGAISSIYDLEGQGSVIQPVWFKSNASQSTGVIISIDQNATFTYITEQEVIGGSGEAEGSGKLYQIQMNLDKYDENGTQTDWISGSVTTLPLVLHIYESNFERVKEKFNDTIEDINRETGGTFPTIDNPQDLVTFINTYLNETSADLSNLGGQLIYMLVAYVDKSFFLGTLAEIPFEISNNMFGNLKLLTGDVTLELQTLLASSTEAWFGLNVHNSCTLTEYGTSSGGGSTPTESSGVDYLQIFAHEWHLTYTFEKGMLDKPELVQNTNELITTFNTQFSVNIPSYTGIDSFPTINSYITSLDSNYNQLKIIWYSSLFYSFNVYAISTLLNVLNNGNNLTLPPMVQGRFDISNNNFSYKVYCLIVDEEAQGMPVVGLEITSSANYQDLSILVNKID